MKSLVVPLLSLVPALALLQGPPPSTVRTDAVRSVKLRERSLVHGDLRAARRARVASEEVGRVVSLEVDEGTHVERGAVLARLDAKRLELDLKVLEAEQGAAAALETERERSLEQAERDLLAVRVLVERNAANQKELEDAETVKAEAEARLAWSRGQRSVQAARVELLRERIADTEVRAPFDGVIAALYVDLGEWVDVGDEVLDLVSEELEVWLAVPQRRLAGLREGQGSLAVRVGGADEILTADTWRVVPVVDPSARQLLVIAALPAAPGLAPGMSATAWVPIGTEAEHTTVASDALLRNEIGPYLYVAVPGAEGQPWSARPVQVDVLWREGTRAVVAGPLQAGEATIVEGKQRLYPGAPVLPVDPTGGQRAGAGAGGAPGGDGSSHPTGRTDEASTAGGR